MSKLVDARQCNDLVASIRAGDRQAETMLVELFGRPVALLLNRQTSGRPEAEDLYQETFIIAIEKIRAGDLREPSRLPGFLSHLARSLATEHYRKTTRRKTDTVGETFPERPSSDHDQLDLLTDRENAEFVRDVLNHMRNQRDCEILWRYYLAEQSKDRIAADLGLTHLQFNRVLHRARERYRNLFLERAGGKPSWAVLILCLLVIKE